MATQTQTTTATTTTTTVPTLKPAQSDSAALVAHLTSNNNRPSPTHPLPNNAYTSTGAAITPPSGPVNAELVFFSPPSDGSVPFRYVEAPPPGEPVQNYGEHKREVTIHDARGQESQFSTDVQGFAFVSGETSAELFVGADDDERIKRVYYPEVERTLLANLPGRPNRVFIFDHTIRRSAVDAPRGPVTRAHVDQTERSAVERVRYHLPDEAEELLKGRFRLVNVWRGINSPLVAKPLAYADSRSVGAHSVTPVEHRYPHRTGETAGVYFDEAAKWHYLSGVRADERIFLQCYDSQSGARTPHTAFVDPRTEDDWPGRESVEVRALVFG